MSIEQNNEHDITRKMLNVIRENHTKGNRLIKEGFGENGVGDSNENKAVSLSQEELNQEHNTFRDLVSARVDFTTFKIYPDVSNVIFGGVLQNGMEWQLSLEESNGLYITANNLQLDDETINLIKKLKGFYDRWADEWAKKINTEYKNGDRDENGL